MTTNAIKEWFEVSTYFFSIQITIRHKSKKIPAPCILEELKRHLCRDTVDNNWMNNCIHFGSGSPDVFLEEFNHKLNFLPSDTICPLGIRHNPPFRCHIERSIGGIGDGKISRKDKRRKIADTTGKIYPAIGRITSSWLTSNKHLRIAMHPTTRIFLDNRTKIVGVGKNLTRRIIAHHRLPLGRTNISMIIGKNHIMTTIAIGIKFGSRSFSISRKTKNQCSRHRKRWRRKRLRTWLGCRCRRDWSYTSLGNREICSGETTRTILDTKSYTPCLPWIKATISFYRCHTNRSAILNPISRPFGIHRRKMIIGNTNSPAINDLTPTITNQQFLTKSLVP